MHTAYNYSEEFAPAREQFEKLVIQLQHLLSADHGQIETCIRIGGFELLRRLFQGHLDLRAICEEPLVDVTGSDAVARTHIRTGCKRNLMTLFGQVKVRRIGYSARSVTSLFPMDAQLNLPVDKQSHGVRKQLAHEVLAKSFDQSVLRLADTSGAKVAKLQAEQLTAKLSEDFGTFYEQQNDGAEQTDDILIMTIDGKGIVMNEKSLRECTQKAAKTEKHKMKTRLSKGEKRNRKRMATVASVYSVAEHKRIPEAIMGSEDEQPGAVRPRAKNKRVWASVERDPKDVAEEMVTEALSRDPERLRRWAVLLDGQASQLSNVRASISRNRVKGVTIILDFVHVLEYLWEAAFCFAPQGGQDAEKFVQERALNILKGIPGQVAAGLRRKATLNGLTPEQRAPVDKCADYIQKHKKFMQYRYYLEKGFPIASGVIEGACRHLIKDRMDITGARWGLVTAEAILKLRSLKSSNDLQEYWTYHAAQELRRNHASLYFDHKLPVAA